MRHTGNTPMTDDVHNPLLAQLRAHRRTLAQQLEQRAKFGAGFVPAHLDAGIIDARAAIARLKAALRADCVEVDDEPNDRAEITPTASFALPLDTIPNVAPLPTGSRMPYARNALFVGREPDLRALAAAFMQGSTAAIGQIAAATGLGGIGKTQLAVEFVHRYGQFFTGGVFWLSFAEPANVPSEVVTCGSGLNLPAFADLAQPEQVARVRQLWQAEAPRLLVFDNCEDEAQLTEWRPSSGGSRVLVTSRRAEWDATLGVAVRALNVLPRVESVALLRGFRPDLPESERKLEAIAAELGDLPLALHLAGSYLKLNRHDLSPAEYLAELQSPTLLAHPSLEGQDLTISPTNHVLHVARTFALSYDQLDEQKSADALARQLLARTACLAPGEPIPRDLLKASLVRGINTRQFGQALRRLIGLGLVEAMDDGRLRLHRLIGAFVRGIMSDSAAQADIERALTRQVAQVSQKGYPLHAAPFQAHLRYVTDLVQVRMDSRAGELCSHLGSLLEAQGNLVGARPYMERALAIWEQKLGPTHRIVAKCLNNLGGLLDSQGDLAGAQGYYERALAILEQTVGAADADIALILNNMGQLLQAQGDLAGARSYLERALAIWEQSLGPVHPNTAKGLNNMGQLLQAQGDLAGARPYVERALAIWEQSLGPVHPNTAFGLNNLGHLLQVQGDLAGARPYVERALAIWERTLGATHPSTAMGLNNLGQLLQAQGDLAGAQSSMERALAIWEQSLGAADANTAMGLNNLGHLLQEQGDLAGAQSYLERALTIWEQSLGTTHPTTALSLNNLGHLLQAQGDLAGARLYFERALAIFSARLGDDHPNTHTAQDNLAQLLSQT